MKIGIFGGSFNPPHKMHKDIISKLIKYNYIDKAIVVPVADKYSKPNLLKGEDRLSMVETIFKKDENVLVSDCEISSKCSYTIETLNYYKKIYPNDDLLFILGTDLLKNFYKWKDYEEILKKYKLIVISREDDDFNEIMDKYEKYSDKITLANISKRNISSSKIRMEILKKGFTEELKKYLYAPTIKYLKGIDFSKYWK